MRLPAAADERQERNAQRPSRRFEGGEASAVSYTPSQPRPRARPTKVTESRSAASDNPQAAAPFYLRGYRLNSSIDEAGKRTEIMLPEDS
jgi:hypothetical protein